MKKEGIRAINFDCKVRTKSHVCGKFSVRDEGKLLQHVIISYMTECSNTNHEFIRCMITSDNTLDSKQLALCSSYYGLYEP